MIEENKLDLGSIQIHKKVLADITSSAVSEIGGVRLVSNNLASHLGQFLGQKTYPGIMIHVDKNNQVVIEVKVYVRFGLNIPDIARVIQDAIRTAIEQTVDIDLQDINVNIQGIERGES